MIRSLFFAGLFFTLAPGVTLGQSQRIPDRKSDFVLLELSSGFITVAKEARVDLDSSLLIAARRHGLSRIPVITEGFDEGDTFADCGWMDEGDPIRIKNELTTLRGRAHARSLLLLGAYYSFHPGFQTVYIEQAVAYLRQGQKECRDLHLPEWSAENTILLGKCFMKAGKSSEGMAAFRLITDDTGRSWKLRAKAWNYAGMYGPYLPNTIALRISCLEKAVALYQEQKDAIAQIDPLMNSAYLNFAAGRLSESEAAAGRSYALQKATGFPYTHYSRDLMAYIHRLKGDYATELRWALEAVGSAESTKDSLGLAYFYARVGDSYYQDENHMVESNQWFNRSLTEFLKHGGDPALYRIFANQNFIEYGFKGGKEVLALLNDLLKSFPPLNPIDQQYAYLAIATCYENMGQFPMAEKYNLMAERLEKTNNLLRNNVNSGYVYHRLGAFYLHMGDYKKSRLYSLRYVSDTTNANMDSLSLAKTYWIIVLADSALGDFPKMKHLYIYTQLANRLYTKTKNKAVEELNIRYQTLQKEKDLQLYKERNLLQQQQAAASRRFSYAALTILVLIIVMILLGYLSKQKSNQALQLQKEEIDQKNRLLQDVITQKDELLVSKEWLLKEVHHRVKNNLQLMISLLNSQTAYLKDEAALNAVLDSRHRVQAMSLIHQKLYKQDNIASVDMREYIRSLVDYLKDSYKTKLSVYFELQLEPIELDVNQAVPVGLILNEVITNSLKYAFPHSGEDRILISFGEAGSGQILLVISDNGKGLPEGIDLLKTRSFGMILIKGLTDDLGGRLSVLGINGTTVRILFQSSDYLKKGK